MLLPQQGERNVGRVSRSIVTFEPVEKFVNNFLGTEVRNFDPWGVW